MVILLANYSGLRLGWKFASRESAVAKNGLDSFLGEYSLIFPNELFGNRQESDRNIIFSKSRNTSLDSLSPMTVSSIAVN